MWEVSGTNEFADWYDSLNAKIDERVELLAQSGREASPTSSRRDNKIKLQEHERTSLKVGASTASGAVHLRPTPRGVPAPRWRQSRRCQWNDWYIAAVPAADALYENYLDETGQTDEEKN